MLGLADLQAIQILDALTLPKPLAEIQRQTGLPKSSVHKGLKKLLEGGLIRRTPNGFEATIAAELVVSTIRRVQGWNKLQITDYDILKAYRDIERDRAIQENRGYTPAKQFLELLESVENVKVATVTPDIRRVR